MRKRLTAALLCLCLLFTLLPATAFAEGEAGSGAPQAGSALCEHHPQHDESCGYTEGTEEVPCTHEHDEDCYKLVTECVHEHTAECYPEESVSENTATPSEAEEAEPTACTHVCSEESGCITKALDCKHEHDEACGYVPATEGSSCTFGCEVCNTQDKDSEATATPSDAQPEECTCETLCTGEEINGDCPVCSAEGAEIDKVCVGAAPMLPVTALAAGTGTDTGKAIQLGTSGIAGYDSAAGYDYIYFGSWTAQDTYTTSGPIKWRVLDDQTNTGETGLFLLSDGLLGTGYYGGVYFDNTSPYSNTWQGSDAQAWCNTFASSNLDSRELAAILETTKSDDAFTSSTYSVPFAASENILNGDKVFFLSAEEAENSAYGFANDNARIANYGGSACAWWLRSPYAGYTDGAGAVYGYGYVDFITVNDDWAARPAFNLDLNSVLFTSAAESGKIPAANGGGNQGGEAGDAIFEIGDYDGSEWKLTLLDNSRNFAVTEQTVSGAPGGTITLNYTGATTGENEYISVIIADENGAQYYGRVAQPGGGSGTATLSIPADLAPGSYTLNVFSEQYNGDYKTDYASAFAEVALTVEEAAAPGIDTGKAIQLVDSGTAANISGAQADNIYFGTYQQSSDGNSGYNIDPIKWRVLENANGQLFLLSDQNLDVFQYHTDRESVTWEKSTMRSWLNGYSASHNTGGSSGTDYTGDNFIGAAFSEKEQGAIADTTVVNDNNPTYGTEGGENTNDKIFLLSIAEANNDSYFADNSSRIATNTAYVAGGGKIGGGMLGVGEADNWWLRSPGNDDDIAAYVNDNGGVRSLGPNVDFVITAVRPAFNLDLNSVLFTSAAVGGKSANGMDSGLTAVDDYTGSEWKLTLLDETREFAVMEQTVSGKPGDTITLNYTGATTGENEYISVIIADSSGAQYYGRVAQPAEASGTAEVTIPAGLAAGTYTLYVFSEQYNGGEQDDTKLTDYASAFETVALTVSSDTTAPTLTPGSATRNSDTTATVKFTSSEAGTYYYAVVESGDTAPTIDTTGEGTSCDTAEQTISLTSLSGAGAKDIYIVAKDAAGNVSQPLKITIPAYIAPSYGISASPAALNFGSKTVDYTEAPAAQTVTLTNTGNQNVTVDLPTSTNYIITAGEGFTNDTATLAPNGTAAFTVQPKTGLAAGSYDETLTISGDNNTSANIALSFEVDVKLYSVTVNGSYAQTTGAGSYAEGATVTIDAGTRSGYTFDGWTSSDGVTFANAGSTQTTFTMPDKAVTVTANWTKKSSEVSEQKFIRYIVEHYKQNADGSYTLAETERPIDEIGKTVTATPKTYEGYTYNPNAAGTVTSGKLTEIKNDADIVTLKLYYDITLYTVTVNGSYAQTTGAGSYAEGDTVKLDAGTCSGYTFDGWTSSDGVTFANAGNAQTTFTMPDKAVTVTANWTKRSSGGGGGGSSSSSGGGSYTGPVGVYYADSRNDSIPSDATQGTWEQETASDGSIAWKFKLADGSYAADRWIKALWNDQYLWYHMDTNGYLQSGWFTDMDGNIYYLHPFHDGNFGYMYTGDHVIDGIAYNFSRGREQDGLPEGALKR